MSNKLMRIRVETKRYEGLFPLGWSLKVTNAETGEILPVSANDPFEIIIDDFSGPIKARCTLLISEIDIEAILEHE